MAAGIQQRTRAGLPRAGESAWTTQETEGKCPWEYREVTVPGVRVNKGSVVGRLPEVTAGGPSVLRSEGTSGMHRRKHEEICRP